MLRPEFFFLFGFLVQLWYGTGGVVTPVTEQITVAEMKIQQQSNFAQQADCTQSEHTLIDQAVLNEQVHFSEGPGGYFSTAPGGGRGKGISSSTRNSFTTEAAMEAISGPNHAASALTLWRLLWCFLRAAQMFYGPLQSVYLGGCFQKDHYTSMQCGILFLTGLFVLRVSYGWQKTAAISHPEYVYQAMLALMGQYLLIQTTDLMSMYLCMEQQSFSLVVLCGLNSKSAYSIEAAMKYFQLSAFRSCQLLLGIGFIYWQTGETKIRIIENIAESTRNEPSLLQLLGIWFVSTGLLWKQAAAPLHFWVPDVYTGAWSSVSLWITVLPKIAVLGFWTHHWQALWSSSFGSTLAFFRILSMIIGGFAPLAQTNLKRLLAYSSIGHMGLLLMPLCVQYGTNGDVNTYQGPLQGYFSPAPGGGRGEGVGAPDRGLLWRGVSASTGDIGALWTHMFIYIQINLGVWGLIMWPVTRPATPSVKRAGPQYIWDLKGLNQSSATAAFRWAVMMTSLAGLPPVYGFQGKAQILWDSVNNGQYTTVAIALLYTLVGAVYYLKVMKVCYVDNPNSWRTYAKTSPITAYIVAISVRFMMLGLWCGNIMFQYTHLLAQASNSFFYISFNK